MSQELSNNLSNHTSLGKYLEHVRLEKGYTIEDVVSAISIQKHFLIALEEDDYSALPERTYALGYLRGYAKFLEIPCVDDLVELLDKMYSFEQPAYSNSNKYKNINSQSNHQAISNKSNKSSKKSIFFIIFFIIILCVAVIWVYQIYLKKDKKQTDIKSVAATKTMNTLVDNAVVVPTENNNDLDINNNSSTIINRSNDISNNNVNNDISAETVKEETNIFKPTITAYPKENIARYLEINFDAPVRVTIYSKTDNKIIYLHKLFKVGETYQVPGVSGLVMDVSDYKAAYLIVDSNILYFKPSKPNAKPLYHIDLDKNNLLRKYKS